MLFKNKKLFEDVLILVLHSKETNLKISSVLVDWISLRKYLLHITIVTILICTNLIES